MSATLQNYYRKLDDLRRIAGASNEGALRSAFQTLLETIGNDGIVKHVEFFIFIYLKYKVKKWKNYLKLTMLKITGVSMGK